MSVFEKDPYLSTSYYEKKESILEQDSRRRLKVVLKKLRSDDKVHDDKMASSACTNNHIETTSNETTAVDESVKSTDGIVPKVRQITLYHTEFTLATWFTIQISTKKFLSIRKSHTQ